MSVMDLEIGTRVRLSVGDYHATELACSGSNQIDLLRHELNCC
jgi:hypothetical protein